VDIIGQRSAAVFSDPLQIKDTRPPLVPMGLKAVDREDGVLLVWNLSPEADVDYYNIYRSDSLEGEYEKINGDPVPVDTTRFFDSGVERGRAWYYSMTAVDEAGNESPRCGAQTIIPVDAVPPAEVSGLDFEVNAEERAVSLVWDASPEKDLAGYLLYRRLGDGSYTRITPKPLSPQKRPSYRDTGVGSRPLRPGGRYSYAVTAVDHSGNESSRSEIRVAIPDLVPPRKVFSFSARTTRAGAVQLRWQPALDRDMAVHRIYRRSVAKSSSEPQLIMELEAAETSATDEEVRRGVAYLYHIVEVDAAGNTSEPSPEERVIPLDLKPPSAPRELQARRSGGDLLLTWRPPEDGDVAGYRVYRAPYPKAGERELTEEPLKATEYRRRSGADDVGAVYIVTAVDTSGNEGEEAQMRLEEEQ
jgi:fibronectin type 3 domain-containing protein